jgi:sensor histidine kinase YesM
VRDSGAGEHDNPGAVAAHEGHGIGLSNTRERLVHFYHDDFQMRAEPLREGGFEVAISIPYEPLVR